VQWDLALRLLNFSVFTSRWYSVIKKVLRNSYFMLN